MLLLLLTGATAYVWLFPFGRFPQPVLVRIPQHSGSWTAATRLAEAGVVRSAGMFEAWVLLHPGQTLKAGTYRFSSPASMRTVAQRLVRGDVYTVNITIPEGFNRFDIARLVEQQHLGSASAFLQLTASPALVRRLDPQAVSLEGYLFPDTYKFEPGTSLQTVIETMVRRFEVQSARLHLNAVAPPQSPSASPTPAPAVAAPDKPVIASAAAPPRDLHTILTIASMVEKETAVPAERPLIAGVFYARLAAGLPLQCDPTVIYAAELVHSYTGELHTVDLQRPSPYNTYVHAGLPPGPIANPGAAALQAAAHPRITNYLYFVSNGHGGHRFASTLEEQNRNVQRYLRAERAQKATQ